MVVTRARLDGHVWPIAQTAVAAVAAWYIAVLLGAEQHPVFASIAAVISLGATFGERRQRALQLISGVVLGIVVADLLMRAIGSGLPQIGLLVVLAMVAATLLGGGELLVTEAAVSAMLVASLAPSTAQTRLLEVLVGGGVALFVHSFVFPPNPVVDTSRAVHAVFGELGSALRDAAAALATGDVRRAEAAVRATEQVEVRVSKLRDVVTLGAETTRWAPLRRGARAEFEGYARTMAYGDFALRNTQVLVRHVLHYVRSGRPADSELADAVSELALAVWELPAQFEEPWRGGDVARYAMAAAGRATAAAARHPDIALSEIAGQVRSVAIDIVKASDAGETDRGALVEAPTEDLLAGIPIPEPSGTAR
jgi:uncharacterized membrane protein YgaE (UPF0421/DUF939 family)